MNVVVRWKFNPNWRTVMQALRSNYIDGKLDSVTDHETFKSTDPAYPETTIALFPESTEGDVSRATSAARKAFPTWKGLGLVKRSENLWRFAKLI